MRFGILGSGSWGTALAKILTDNGQHIHWWIRNEQAIEKFKITKHNPSYLTDSFFDINRISFHSDIQEVADQTDVILIAIPSAYSVRVLSHLNPGSFNDHFVISAVKGILPDENLLLNDWLKMNFRLPLEKYFAVLGPCHAEEVAAEKLSYLTFTGVDEAMTQTIAANFKTAYLNTVLNKDIYGVQYAAVLKNIYAVGAGIADGLGYGDNFLSVLIANSADEMAGFLRKAGIINAEVGYIEHRKNAPSVLSHNNYAASVYLGDLLVTCYSLFSRNRRFGNMIGTGKAVAEAQKEMTMVAEGYNASRSMKIINQKIMADMPIADGIFKILWEAADPRAEFQQVESILV